MLERFGLPLNASTYGGSIDDLNLYLHWLMAILFVGWGGFFVYTLVRFRRSRNPKADYVGVKSHVSKYLEIAVVIAEVLLLVVISIPIWISRVEGMPAEKDAVVVRVVAEQFQWNIHYPGPDGVFARTDPKLVNPENNALGIDPKDPAGRDDITTVNQLFMPTGKPVIVHLSSKDVIHSFGIPLLRVKLDAIPGHEGKLWFEAKMTTAEVQAAETKRLSTRLKHDGPPMEHLAMEDLADEVGKPLVKKGDKLTKELLGTIREAGVKDILCTPATPVEIACAQLCGLGHYRMRGTVIIQTPEEFAAWLKSKAPEPPAVETDTAAK